MVRTLAFTAALTALLGFAAGWLFFDRAKTLPTVGPPSATATASAATTQPPPGERRGGPPTDAFGSAAVVQRFALRPADVSADRETTAVAVAPDGTVVLAWASQAEAGDAERTLYLARSTDGGTTFGTPVAWRRVPLYRYTSEGGGGKGPKRAFRPPRPPPPRPTAAAGAPGW